MAGLDPAIHAEKQSIGSGHSWRNAGRCVTRRQPDGVDGRDKPGHDGD